MGDGPGRSSVSGGGFGANVISFHGGIRCRYREVSRRGGGMSSEVGGSERIS